MLGNGPARGCNGVPVSESEYSADARYTMRYDNVDA
jgi:hypothetical protein